MISSVGVTDEGSFRENRQNVFELGVADAERVVLAPLGLEPTRPSGGKKSSQRAKTIPEALLLPEDDGLEDVELGAQPPGVRRQAGLE
jgi:hypothetical protein